jgi:1-phosphofructokinase family hexose kinase
VRGSPHGERPLVLTVTPNPSLDLLFETESLVWDDANRMRDPRRRPGGQGINVTRAALALGGRSEAVALLGGRTGDELIAMLDREGTPLRVVRGQAETRTFVAVRETATGRTLLLNARGPARSPSEVEAFRAAVEDALRQLRPAWIACCGSLPAGFPTDFYATLAASARTMGTKVVVDCDGEPLSAAAAAGCDLLVPNEHEVARLAGTLAGDPDAAAAAARALQARGTQLVAVTLGPGGAILAGPAGTCHARPPALQSGSAVGAGDAFLAGLLVALEAGVPFADVLRHATAAGSAVLLSGGTRLLDAEDAIRLSEQVACS